MLKWKFFGYLSGYLWYFSLNILLTFNFWAKLFIQFWGYWRTEIVNSPIRTEINVVTNWLTLSSIQKWPSILWFSLIFHNVSNAKVIKVQFSQERFKIAQNIKNHNNQSMQLVENCLPESLSQIVVYFLTGGCILLIFK